MKKAFANFFKSIGEDIKSLFTKHYLKLIGYVVSFIVPIAFLVGTYIYKKPNCWALPIFVWFPLIIFIIVYWMKLRTYLAVKINGMQVENNIEKGKHAGMIIVVKTIQILMTVAPFLLCYFVFKSLSDASIKIENLFLFLTLCEGIGGLFVVGDTIMNVVDFESDAAEDTTNQNK